MQRLFDKVKNFSYLIKCKNKANENHNSYEDKIMCMQLKSSTEKAKHDWLHAYSYFESVTEPDLVDYAIYSVQAEEKKYSYMLKKLKEHS